MAKMPMIGSVAALMVALSAPAAHSAVLSLETDPDPARVGIGETVEVSLVTPPGFGAFSGVELDVTYDAKVLSYETTKFHPAISMLTSAQHEANGAEGPHTIRAITGSAFLGDGGSGAAILATLSFGAVGIGTSEVEIGGFDGTLVVGPGLDETLSTSVEVVPLPAPVVLLGSGLAALGLLRHRARGASSSTRSA
jgi:hypothetical protein